jgi:hypothetical protein
MLGKFVGFVGILAFTQFASTRKGACVRDRGKAAAAVESWC